MLDLTVLRGYAQRVKPETLPPSVLFEYTDHCLTVFDAFPKSIFHFLILPRVRTPLDASELTNLRTLLSGDKARAKQVLVDLSDEANKVKKMIREEMQSRFGFRWEIWTGFHVVQSMEHLHLHVLSSDLCSEKLKHKKHYNSFHPKLGYFLHLDEVLSWFDEDPSNFARMSQLKKSEYEHLLKESLCCWRCERDMKNMPLLKAHLQEEWDVEGRKARAGRIRKRKRDDAASDVLDDKEPESKRPSPGVSSQQAYP